MMFWFIQHGWILSEFCEVKETKPKRLYCFFRFKWGFGRGSTVASGNRSICGCLGLELGEGLTTTNFGGRFNCSIWYFVSGYYASAKNHRIIHLKEWIFILFQNLKISQDVDKSQDWMYTIANESTSIINKWHNHTENGGKERNIFPHWLHWLTQVWGLSECMRLS